MTEVDDTIEVAIRRARMDAARGCSAIVAAMAAGSGAELVARQQLSREILEQRLKRSAERRLAAAAGGGA